MVEIGLNSSGYSPAVRTLIKAVPIRNPASKYFPSYSKSLSSSSQGGSGGSSPLPVVNRIAGTRTAATDTLVETNDLRVAFRKKYIRDPFWQDNILLADIDYIVSATDG